MLLFRPNIFRVHRGRTNPDFSHPGRCATARTLNDGQPITVRRAAEPLHAAEDVVDNRLVDLEEAAHGVLGVGGVVGGGVQDDPARCWFGVIQLLNLRRRRE